MTAGTIITGNGWWQVNVTGTGQAVAGLWGLGDHEENV